jgi:VCBS repeat-containing protein
VFQDDFENSTLGTANTLYREEVTFEVVTFDRATAVESTPAEFLELTASIDADDAEILMGTVSVFDPDEGENLIVAQAPTNTTFGSFTIMPSGAWEYTLDTANETIAALLKGETETDTISIASVDGTAAEVVITIKGVIEEDTGSDQAARITDTSTADAGELRFKPSATIEVGRMTATILREAGAKAESPNEDAQIAIFGGSTSTDPAMAYITLDISGDDYDLRSPGSSSGGGSESGFLEDQEINFEIAWDASAATDSVAPLVTVTIDGVAAFGGQFSSLSSSLLDVQDGVETIFFRVGGTGDESDFGLIVDDFVVYSSDSGSEVAVHTDDFESYTLGNSLDPDADTNGTAPIVGAVPDPTTPYDSSSFDVFVVGEN